MPKIELLSAVFAALVLLFVGCKQSPQQSVDAFLVDSAGPTYSPEMRNAATGNYVRQLQTKSEVLIGQSESKAVAFAEENGIAYFLYRRDGHGFPVSEDADNHRLFVAVDNGLITDLRIEAAIE